MNSEITESVVFLPAYLKAVLLANLAVLLFSCSGGSTDQAGTQRSLLSQEESITILQKFHQDSRDKELTGAQLAQVYCGTCHLFPDPQLLDKRSWLTKVLPNMGARMGVRMPDPDAKEADYSTVPYGLSLTPGYAVTPLISEPHWEKIVNYYKTLAPELSLPQETKKAVKPELTLFKMRKPEPSRHLPPLTTLLRYNPQDKLLYLGNRQSMLYTIDPIRLVVVDSLQTPSPPADIKFEKEQHFRLLSMGIMDPSNLALGRLDKLHMGLKKQNASPLLDSLARPVQAVFADLDLDGQEDIVVCEFGFNSGNLSWYKNKGSHYEQHILNPLPGARRVVAQDMDSDGRPDLVVLMTQAQEGLYVYYNKATGFVEKPLLKFPPVYGSSDFSLVDINKDGALDILYTFGDNADYSYSLKSYHGVRLFLNTGRDEYKEAWSYPMHGAFRAIAEDFDQDGDLDIAAIAYFPDFAGAPQESFIYFEQDSTLTFTPRTFETTPSGRWLTMESGDFDQDGDLDLVLGSFILGPAKGADVLMAQWKSSGIPYLILENSLRSPARGQQNAAGSVKY